MSQAHERFIGHDGTTPRCRGTDLSCLQSETSACDDRTGLFGLPTLQSLGPIRVGLVFFDDVELDATIERPFFLGGGIGHERLFRTQALRDQS